MARCEAHLRVEALLLHTAGVDDVAAVVDGHGGLGDVGREDDLAHAGWWSVKDLEQNERHTV